jgi:PAS domain S-box-containing protein
MLSTERSLEVMNKYNENLKKIGEVKVITKHRRKDGSAYDVSIFIKYHADIDGGIFTAFTRDITARAKGIEELKVSTARYQSLLMAADRLIIVDTDMRILDGNNSFLAMSGKTLAQLVGTKFTDLFHSRSVKRTEKIFRNTIQSTVVQRDEGWTRLTKRYLLRTFTPVFDDTGKVVAVTIMGTDITNTKQERTKVTAYKVNRMIQGNILPFASSAAG